MCVCIYICIFTYIYIYTFVHVGRAVGRQGGRMARRVEGRDEFRVGMVAGIHKLRGFSLLTLAIGQCSLQIGGSEERLYRLTLEYQHGSLLMRRSDNDCKTVPTFEQICAMRWYASNGVVHGCSIYRVRREPFSKKGLENRSSRFEPKNSWLSFSRGSGPPLRRSHD